MKVRLVYEIIGGWDYQTNFYVKTTLYTKLFSKFKFLIFCFHSCAHLLTQCLGNLSLKKTFHRKSSKLFFKFSFLNLSRVHSFTRSLGYFYVEMVFYRQQFLLFSSIILQCLSGVSPLIKIFLQLYLTFPVLHH